MRENVVKQALKAGKPSVGTWLSSCSPIVARFLARTGFQWLTVDIEHSPVNWETAAAMFGAIADQGCVPLARVPAAKHDYIKRVLDNGAFGFVAPMIMSREEAELCVKAAKHPPLGNRSIGGSLHALNFDTTPVEYYRHANNQLTVILQCEHIEAAERAEEIYSVPGIDAVFVGPNDLEASMRKADGTGPSPEAIEAALAKILAACKKNGVAAGLHCFSAAEVERRIKEGWQFLALGSDLSLLLQSAKQELGKLSLAPVREVAKY